MRKDYGRKRDYPKINIQVDGNYICSTTWSKSLKEAVEVYKGKPDMPQGLIIASFDQPRRRAR